ncbi:DUF2235 domain-containing protein [Pseudomonas sp.]|uniref:T6SS phospholipase effector Tle1-like catalytic domain-containing protein n=1 Tax=Pseudomonas sp. TaxID=306 RepID=UPI002636041D|nr:DUF2235 domain-containing protein [Pseudomonas sp.]
MKEHDPKSCRICQANRPKGIEDMTPQQLAAREELQKPYLAGIAAGDAHRAAAARRVADHEAKEQASKIKVTLVIGVFFDGTGNNASNTEAGILCGAHHAVKPADLDSSCQPYMSDPDSSYGNDFTNVKKLSDLYYAPDELEGDRQEKMAYRKIYIDGIGTLARKKDSYLGSGLGRGETGVTARVQLAFDRIEEIISDLAKENSSYAITHIIFDTFGFSRGAAAARHFANLVALGRRGPLRGTFIRQRQTFERFFHDEYNCDIHIGFVGVFDTVASVIGMNSLLRFNRTGTDGLSLNLPRSQFPHVVHLVARDEYRYNFPLSRVSAGHSEITLPGAHSDIGGGYRLEAEECLLVSPMQVLTVAKNCDVKSTAIYHDAEQEMKRMIGDGWPAHLLEIITPEPTILDPDSTDRMAPRQKRIYVALQLKRSVRGELSQIYLRVMHQLAKQKKVRFLDIPELPNYIIPSELQSLCDRFVAGDYSTTPGEEALLRARYIHLSAHWNHPLGQAESGRHGPRVFYINSPAEARVRVLHPSA